MSVTHQQTNIKTIISFWKSFPLPISHWWGKWNYPAPPFTNGQCLPHRRTIPVSHKMENRLYKKYKCKHVCYSNTMLLLQINRFTLSIRACNSEENNYALTARREAEDIYSRTMIREAILIRSCWDFLLFFAWIY